MGCGKAFDPSFFIFDANILGSPFGTTSPLSINPSTGRQYDPDFSPTNSPICYGQGTRDGAR
ncbi:hypothetical protein B0H14DRAFT_2358822 [Mycena olivaceomarginata]|nr:hypothetical protein B0H14DRAFT_2358822 [Mycena olivaceomarginata]